MTREELFALHIDEPDKSVYDKAKDHFDMLAKPIDGFGEFEDMICRIAAIQGRVCPDISKRALAVMFADNGVVESGVSQTDSSVTLDVARLFAKGESTVCVMTKGFDIDTVGVDVGIDSDEKIPGIIDRKVSRGTKNIEKEPAMTQEQCLEAVTAGIDIVKGLSDKGFTLIATGEMGIGNTTTATALLCALTGVKAKEVTGRGAGLSDEGLAKKLDVIQNALKLHGAILPDKVSAEYALKMLTVLGGLDIAALTGVFIGGALCRIPVVTDGLISAVAALTATYILPGCEKYMIASHQGRERGTRIALSHMGLKAVIDADMALGEGTGAVMIIPVIDMIINVYNQGTSFESAQIQQYERYAK